MRESRVGLRVRCYLASARILNRFLALAHALFAGFWLGILRHADLQELDAVYYARKGMYRAGDYNRGGLFRWEREAVSRYFPARGKLLVTAAGGGREVLALLRMGYVVDAFECNRELAGFANSLLTASGYPPSVAVCERDVCPPLDGPYDGAIVGWSSFMLIPGRLRRIRFLNQLRRAVRPGEPILLSFAVGESGHRTLAAGCAFGNLFRRLRGAERIEPGDDLSPNFVHHFSREEVARTLEAAGFRLAHFSTEEYGHAVAFAGGSTERIEAAHREVSRL
jgi:hypothetical protein